MEQLELISIYYLREGLVLTDDIFNYNGKLLLVSRGTVMTKQLIEHLMKFNKVERNIRVSAKLHQELIEQGIPEQFTQKYLEDNIGYTEVKDETKKMIDEIESTNSISHTQTDEITNLLLDKVWTVAPALLFQCINGGNEIDEYLYRHSANVGLINGLMGKWLNLEKSDVDALVLLGLVHDVGKVKVDQEILNSPRKLTDAEFAIVKSHSKFSYDMLTVDKLFEDRVCLGALYHHERMNGTGYPNALTADDIPVFARITSIADIYDAMVSKRVYKQAQSPFTVLLNLQQGSFAGLDIRLVNVFMTYMPFELIDKPVLLSNGSVGIVKHIDMTNLEFPMVQIGEEIIFTSPDLHCVSMVADNW